MKRMNAAVIEKVIRFLEHDLHGLVSIMEDALQDEDRFRRERAISLGPEINSLADSAAAMLRGEQEELTSDGFRGCSATDLLQVLQIPSPAGFCAQGAAARIWLAEAAEMVVAREERQRQAQEQN